MTISIDRKRERFMEKLGHKKAIAELKKSQTEFEKEIDKYPQLKLAFAKSPSAQAFSDALRYADAPQDFMDKWERYNVRAAQLNHVKDKAIEKLSQEGKLEDMVQRITQELEFEDTHGKPMPDKLTPEQADSLEKAQQKLEEHPDGIHGMRNAAEVIKSKWKGSDPESHYRQQRIKDAADRKETFDRIRENQYKQALDEEVAKRKNHKEYMRRQGEARQLKDDSRMGRRAAPVNNEHADEFNKKLMAEADKIEPNKQGV